MVISISGKGQMLGEEDAIQRRNHTLTARVRSGTALCYRIKASDFRSKIARDARGKATMER